MDTAVNFLEISIYVFQWYTLSYTAIDGSSGINNAGVVSHKTKTCMLMC